MGLSHYTLRFDQVDGAYDYDPARPLAAVVTVTLDAHSLDVGDPKIAQQFAHQFLDADAYPKITFTSSALIQSDADHGTMTGDLTLRGVTRPITLQVTYDGTESGLIGGRRMGFSATGVVKRSDFGSKALQGPVGDDVELVIEAEFIRK
jgi:polyisoprenoid-binding protein YceI